jgi:hypothetical protein
VIKSTSGALPDARIFVGRIYSVERHKFHHPLKGLCIRHYNNEIFAFHLFRSNRLVRFRVCKKKINLEAAGPDCRLTSKRRLLGMINEITRACVEFIINTPPPW